MPEVHAGFDCGGQHMIDALLGGLWPYIIAAGGALLAFLGAYFKGRGDGKAKEKAKRDAAYRKTRERMDDADDLGDDPGAAARWLRERGKR